MTIGGGALTREGAPVATSVAPDERVASCCAFVTTGLCGSTNVQHRRTRRLRAIANARSLQTFEESEWFVARDGRLVRRTLVGRRATDHDDHADRECDCGGT
jgi:hypothetical protein